ncbi:putative reverse transcriptase domain-containing protein [Tanacetum coccineum]
MSEARMREVIREQVAASMAEFMANINSGAGGDEVGGGGAGGAGASGGGVGGAGAGSAGAGGAGVGGAGPATPEITRCTYITFMKCDPQPFKGTKGTVGLCQWFEKLESVFRISDCKERDKVKFTTAILQGEKVDDRGILSSKCVAKAGARIVQLEVKVEQYIRGLSKNIRGDVTSSRPAGIDEAVHIAYQLMGQIIQDKTDEVSEGEKRKGEADRGGRGDNRRDYNHRQNQKRANVGAMTNVAPIDNEVCPKCKNKQHAGDCWKCGKCGKLGHKTAACWSIDKKDVTCFNCNEKGHRKRDCPKLKNNGQGGNNRGAVYKLGYIEKGCELFLAQVTEQESKEKRLEDVSVIQDFPEVFPKELPGLPPPRQVEFCIDLIPGCTCGACAISFSTIRNEGVVQATARVSNEAIPEVNPVVPEPNQVVDIHDPNEMVDIPDDIDLVDYDKEDSEEEPEEDVELEDDAELIFPYEVEGDKTPPPGDVSSDSVSSNSESEDEEVDVAPEATVGTITQKPCVIRDFLRGLFKVGESSSARDSSYVDGLTPWALRRDLENVEHTLGNVLKRMSVLESGENATLKKILAKTETKLVWARMERETAERSLAWTRIERDTAERRLHESRVWNKRFYLDIVCIGTVPKPPYDDEDTEHPRKKSKNSTPDRTEGPSEPRGSPSDS